MHCVHLIVASLILPWLKSLKFHMYSHLMKQRQMTRFIYLFESWVIFAHLLWCCFKTNSPIASTKRWCMNERVWVSEWVNSSRLCSISFSRVIVIFEGVSSHFKIPVLSLIYMLYSLYWVPSTRCSTEGKKRSVNSFNFVFIHAFE